MHVVPGVSQGSRKLYDRVVPAGGGGGGGGDRIFRPTGLVLVLYRRSGRTILDGKRYSRGGTGGTVCDAPVGGFP